MAWRKCGYTYTTYHEKMTDVNISVEMITDALQNRFDKALLISADSDLVGPVSTVQRLFSPKKVIALFPPGHFSYALKQAAHGILHISHLELAKSQFPNPVVQSGGIALHRPAQWK